MTTIQTDLQQAESLDATKRAAFEKWHDFAFPSLSLMRHIAGYYAAHNVNDKWKAWEKAWDSAAAQQAVAASSQPYATFQDRVQPWMLECFGAEISADRMERNHRFFEEATELVQANGMTRSEAHQLVDYTFGRPAGELHQEVGGVMVTLAALCLASNLNMHIAGEAELTRIWTLVEKIRAKQAAKPKHSPLPECVNQPVQAKALTDDRAAFELWYGNAFGDDFTDFSRFDGASSDNYHDRYLNLAWKAWKGSRIGLQPSAQADLAAVRDDDAKVLKWLFEDADWTIRPVRADGNLMHADEVSALKNKGITDGLTSMWTLTFYNDYGLTEDEDDAETGIRKAVAAFNLLYAAPTAQPQAEVKP